VGFAASFAVALAMALVLACSAGQARATTAQDWTFRVLLDNRPIGQHRFSVVGDADERVVTSAADFAVKILGLTAYSYHHRATERWHGDCLTELTANTEDDGRASSVHSEKSGDTLRVVTDEAAQSLSGCVMSFAYWNPALRGQDKLLNAQTGKVVAVQIQDVGSGTIEVHGHDTPAQQFRIRGAATAIDVWYSPSGEWVGLDATVAGGHHLSYRLP
jgi:hypothetical protein